MKENIAYKYYYLKIFKRDLVVSIIVLIALFVLGLTRPVAALAAGPAPVNLRTAGNFAILSQSGITDIPSSAITGNIGTYPISGAAIGVTCPEVTGTIYSRNAAGPLPCRVINASLLNTAVNNMGTAYTDAATRTPGTGANLNVGSGTLSGQNFVPGTYTWGTPVNITGDITLTGTPTDVWIFQIAGTLNLANGIHVNLAGAVPSNIFWQVADVTTLGTTSIFNGNILDKTLIALQTGATLNGRALAQTAVTLDHSTVTASPANSNPPHKDNDHAKLIHVGLNASACSGPFSGEQKGNVSVRVNDKKNSFEVDIEVHGAKPKTTYDIDIRCVGKIGTLKTNKDGEGEVVIKLPNAPTSPFYVDISIPNGGAGAGGYGDTFIAGPFNLN
jgi:hypothetical protein